MADGTKNVEDCATVVGTVQRRDSARRTRSLQQQVAGGIEANSQSSLLGFAQRRRYSRYTVPVADSNPLVLARRRLYGYMKERRPSEVQEDGGHEWWSEGKKNIGQVWKTNSARPKETEQGLFTRKE